MQLQSKTIQVSQARTVVLDHLDEEQTIVDNPKTKLLTVYVNSTQAQTGRPFVPQIVVQFSGAEYDAFYAAYGDGWTSANLNTALMAKLGLTAV